MTEYGTEHPWGGEGIARLPTGARRRGALAAAVLVAAILVAWPFSPTTYGDDFSYAKTALDFANTGHLRYNGWAAMLLGWQAVWGALFIRVFGFSFNVLRISVIVLAGASMYLFHGVLVRFGMRERDALLGTWSLGMTPLFFPLAASFMTDVPGLFSVLLCVAMCQRAVAARTDRGTVGWIVAAAAGNLVTGSVRQICWLGLLVMVPSTVWYLRRRRGVVVTGAVAWVLGAVVIFWCVHWLNRQPLTVPEHLLVRGASLYGVRHLGVQLLKALLFLGLITLPLGAAWVYRSVREGGASLGRMVVAFVALALIWVVVWRAGHLQHWAMPWLVPVLASQGMDVERGPLGNPVVLGVGTRGVLSVIAAGVGCTATMACFSWWRKRGRSGLGAGFWILGPFSATLLLLLCPRGLASFLQDRYLLLLLPALIVAMLWTYEQSSGEEMPKLCFGVLLPFAFYGVAGLHDQQAASRSSVVALARLQAAGVPRTAVRVGFGPDEWAEVNRTGRVQDLGPSVPTSEYLRQVGWNVPRACLPFDWALSPSIRPEYFLTSGVGGCFAPSGFAPVAYRAWLPPFYRATYIVRSSLPGTGTGTSGVAEKRSVRGAT